MGWVELISNSNDLAQSLPWAALSMVLRKRDDGDRALDDIFREWTGYGWHEPPEFWQRKPYREDGPPSCTASGEVCGINYEWVRWYDGDEKVRLTGKLAQLDWDAIQFDECEAALPTLPWSLRDLEEMQSGR